MFDVLARIQELRESREWSVYKLAKLSGIPQSTIATWYQKNLLTKWDQLSEKEKDAIYSIINLLLTSK